MDATTVGVRLASSALGPLVKRLFRQRQPGAGLVDRPVRLDALVALGAEKDALTPDDLRSLAGEITDRGLAAFGPEAAGLQKQRDVLTDVLAARLGRLGTLDMDDVQAVRLGPDALARALTEPAAETARRGLSAREEDFCASMTTLACLHIINFFTRRSTFIARTLVEQTRQSERALNALKLLAARLPDRASEDAAFEERYRRYLVGRHGRLTVFGLDLDDDWPLDDAYIQLETTRSRAMGDPAQVPQRAEEALRGRERVLLRGIAGAGKTTLVQWLAVTTAEHRVPEPLHHLLGCVPFVLPLRTLTRGDRELPPPGDFLSAVNCPHTPPAGWVERVLADGRGLLLIDGIDEMPEESRATAKAWLRELLREFPGNVTLVSGRPSAMGEDWLSGDGFMELSLASMKQRDVATFIRRWHLAAGAPEDDAQQLLRAVRSRQDLARLATNPLMCAVICALHRSSHGYLPHGRTALYEAALRMLLERRDRQRGVQSSIRLDAETQTLLLQKLAYWLIRNGHAEIDRSDAEAVIDAVLPLMPQVSAQADASAVCGYLLERSGLLREPEEGQIEFVHRTFQDYLGAREAIEARDIPFLVRNAHRDQWEDVVRMAVAHGRPEERKRLLTALVKRGDTTKRHRVRLHLLAMVCLEQATQLDPATRDLVTSRAAQLLPPRTQGEVGILAGIGPVVLELLPEPDHVGADDALLVVQTMTQIGGDAALSRLQQYCGSQNNLVQSQLAIAWTLLDVDAYAETILPVLSRDVSLRANSSAHIPYLIAEDRAYEAWDIEPVLLVEAGIAHRCERLVMSGEWDVTLLSRFTGLRELSFGYDGIPSDFSPIVGSGVRCIYFLPGEGHTLRGLNRLGDIPTVQLNLTGGWDGGAIPPDAAVTWLGWLASQPDLQRIATWPRLRTLWLTGPRVRFTADDIRAIDRAGVADLRLPGGMLSALLDRDVELSRVTELDVWNPVPAPDLDRLVQAFPNVETLGYVTGEGQDISPLAALPRLRSLRLTTSPESALPSFSPEVEVAITPTSRYGPTP
ncbi:NACHT domain-containing protein [Streptomyces sp. NPDC049881]|uniref:NACHT domain-containing protein n=1 Tax=Streptomyces sp. NPDC049881 TaxID=3155778 RepID=UPI00344A226E